MSLEIKNLSKHFGEKIAVQDLNISLQKGQVLGLLGRNGAGKTTTIKMALGLLTPTQGEILWNGKPFLTSGVRFGYLPEERGLYPKSKVVEQLTYFAALEGMSKKEAEKAIDYWLERLEIPEHKHKKASELSKGNQQKIQVIATLLHDPELIILDEPFSGLDPVNAEMLSNIIEEEIQKGKTFVLSSHRMEQIESFCQEIAILKDGNSVVQGNLRQVKNDYGFRNLIIEDNESIQTYLKNNKIAFEHKFKDIYIKVRTEQEALQILDSLKQNDIPLRYFKLLEPTLHEIFVERVR